ncbi:MAG: hypothetical protein AB7P03_28430 [Kofleriaceae bacterium]
MLRLTYACLLAAVIASTGCATDNGDLGGGAGTCVGKCDSDGTAPWWGVNDVSIIVPLGKAGETALMPSLANAAQEGVLISNELWQQIDDGMPLTEGTQAEVNWPKMRVTSMRFDPCFEQTIPDTSCKRVVRLVSQPVAEYGDVVSVTDASLHLFYTLSDDQFVAMLLEYKSLIAGERIDEALYQHPVLARAGHGSELFNEFNQLLTSYLGPDNLFKVTEMATGRSGNNWFWFVYDRAEDGTYKRGLIPTTDENMDGFEIAPRPIVPEELPDIPQFPELLLSDVAIDRMTEAELNQAATEIYAIENPAVTDATNIKCSSCHVAMRVLDYAFKRRQLPLPVDPTFTAPAGQNMILRDESVSRRNMHGLGYFKAATAVTRRVIKESALIADFIGSDAFAETLAPSAREAWDAAREE